MKEAFQKVLTDCGHPLKRRHAFLMLYSNNGSVFTALAEDESGETFRTHHFKIEHPLQQRRCVNLIPVHPLTHASLKPSIAVDLDLFCGHQWVNPEQLRKKRPLHDSADRLSGPEQDIPKPKKNETEGDFLSEPTKLSGQTTVIPIDKIKKITIRPQKGI